MKEDTFLEELKKLTPKQINKLIEEQGKTKLVPMFRYIKNN